MIIEHQLTDLGPFHYPLTAFNVRLFNRSMSALIEALEYAIDRTPESADDEELIEEQTELLRRLRMARVEANAAGYEATSGRQA